MKEKTSYQLKISLMHVEPPIWRRVLVPGDIRLSGLHHVFQTAMGWENCHLYSFLVKKMDYGPEDLTVEDAGMKRDSIRLRDAVPSRGTKFEYRYDFGDGWRHEVVVEKVLPVAAGERLPTCLDGARACPPEDCGGIGGYAEIVEAMKDPSSGKAEEFTEWLGEPYDAEAFSVEAVNRVFKNKSRKASERG